MMKRTVDIVRCCKKDLYPEIQEAPDRIRVYMSKTCNCPIEYYTDAVLNRILLDAMCDYLDSCDRPSAFIRQMADVVAVPQDRELTFMDRVCTSFLLVRVMKDGEYINGFRPEFFDDAEVSNEKV